MAAPPSSSTRPPLPPLMERVRKIKRQLSMTLRGGNSGDKNMTESISSQDTGAHSDSGTSPHPHLTNPHFTSHHYAHFTLSQPSTRHVLIFSSDRITHYRRYDAHPFTCTGILLESRIRFCVRINTRKASTSLYILWSEGSMLHVTVSKFWGFILSKL